ncbi:MAG TPA: DUF4390 domain-containing protein [Casimicrobiaceae bacterium]|nr:DUF4390 domain-containing protein [Casimicrobiaceae bacterium]
MSAASRSISLPRTGASLSRIVAAAVLVALSLLVSLARADTIAVKSADIHADEDAYVLNAEFDFALNPTLEEALQKGVPLYFALDFDLVRPRKYWFDEKVMSFSTQYRVSYNALTRQYRVASGLLGQTFDGLDEVERFLSRVTSRQIARADELSKGMRYEAAIRLRLDVNQLPKPFQLSALGSREWSLQSDWHRWSFTP